jgi:hypothetical protein
MNGQHKRVKIKECKFKCGGICESKCLRLPITKEEKKKKSKQLKNIHRQLL